MDVKRKKLFCMRLLNKCLFLDLELLASDSYGYEWRGIGYDSLGEIQKKGRRWTLKNICSASDLHHVDYDITHRVC